jgi:hypothetical protein
MVSITVKFHGNPEAYTFDVPAHTTILDIKKRIGKQFQRDTIDFRLSAFGIHLPNEKTLDYYGKTDGDNVVIHALPIYYDMKQRGKFGNVMNNLKQKTPRVNNENTGPNYMNINNLQYGGAVIENITFVLITGQRFTISLDENTSIPDTKQAVIDTMNSLGINNGFTAETIHLQLKNGVALDTSQSLNNYFIDKTSIIHVHYIFRRPNTKTPNNQTKNNKNKKNNKKSPLNNNKSRKNNKRAV